MEALTNPSLLDTDRIINRSIRNSELVIIIGSCSIKYKGRATSDIGEGERLVILKEDYSLTVHKKDRHAPINYQTRGCCIHSTLDENKLVLTSTKENPAEKLVIFFSNIKFVGSFDLIDKEDITVLGTERDLVKLVLALPELVEDGLKTEKIEKRVRAGGIDIYARDKNGSYVIVELKRRNVGLDAVTQLKRYVNEVQHYKKERVRGILCAPKVSEKGSRLLEESGLEFIKLDPSIDKFMSGELDLRKEQKKLVEF